MTMDFNKLLEGKDGAEMKAAGITSMDDLLKMMDTPEVQKSMEAGGQNIEEVKKQIEMMRSGMKFSNTLSLFACVNADRASRKDETYVDLPTPAIGGMGNLEALGMKIDAETSAAMTIIDAPKP